MKFLVISNFWHCLLYFCFILQAKSLFGGAGPTGPNHCSAGLGRLGCFANPLGGPSLFPFKKGNMKYEYDFNIFLISLTIIARKDSQGELVQWLHSYLFQNWIWAFLEQLYLWPKFCARPCCVAGRALFVVFSEVVFFFHKHNCFLY